MKVESFGVVFLELFYTDRQGWNVFSLLDSNEGLKLILLFKNQPDTLVLDVLRRYERIGLKVYISQRPPCSLQISSTVKSCRELETTARHWWMQAWVRILFVIIFTGYPWRPVFELTHYCN